MRYIISISFLFFYFIGESQIKTGIYLIQNDSSAAVDLKLTDDFRFDYHDARAKWHYLYLRACGKWSFINDTLILEHKYLKKREHTDISVQFTDCDGSVYTIKNAIEIIELKKYIYKSGTLFLVRGNKNDSTKWGDFDFFLKK